MLSGFRCLAALFAIFPLVSAASATTTGTSGISVSVVTLAAGKLVITGTASTAGVQVRIQGTSITATADAQKKFSFNVDYRTPDCALTLATSTGTLGVLISDCGPGTTPRGAWLATARYNAGDLALY